MFILILIASETPRLGTPAVISNQTKKENVKGYSQLSLCNLFLECIFQQMMR